jgi:adenylyltransferase/sulfurtransferase
MSITPKELRRKLSNKEDIVLIDIREPFEHDDFNIGGILIPINSLTEHIAKIDKTRPVILYCQKGIRSVIAIQRLQQKFGYNNLVNLSGGMDAWKRDAVT